MTLEDKVHAFRLHVLQRAKELGNVSAACREAGISRTLYYRWKKQAARSGHDAVHPRGTASRRGRPPRLDMDKERQVLAITLTWPAFGQEPMTYQVPLGAQPVLDGTIDSDEWADAAAFELGESSTLYLKRANGHVFLAIRATTMGIPSPLIVRGEDVFVLHASAALGTAIYSRQDGVWLQTQAFVWQCRELGFGPSAVAAREAFLEQEGWLGTVGRLGARTEFEYQILLDGESLRVLFLFMEASQRVLSWPATPEETMHDLPLITGPIPGEIAVDFGEWALLVPASE